MSRLHEGARLLLAIDTSIGTSIALGAGEEVREVSSDDPRGHAERIGTMLAEIFELAGARPEAVSGVVVGIGPGPFTGLRVGIAAAQAFALARGVPLLPLHGHEAAAFERLARGEERVRVVQDAKRRELFVTEYTGLDADGIPVRTAAPHIVPRAGYQPVDSEVWPERISAAGLVGLAARRIAAGRGFEAERALYLRDPDVKQPGPVKKVST